MEDSRQEEDDEAILTSLGANVVDQETFEQKFLTHLEEKLAEAEIPEEENETENEKVDNENPEQESQQSIPTPETSKLLQALLGRKSNDAPEKHTDLQTVSNEKKQIQGFSNRGSGSSLGKIQNKSITKKVTPKAVIRPKPKPSQQPQKEETEQERRIRNGEITPFGSELVSNASSNPKDSFLDLDKYLKGQMELQKSRRKLVEKKKLKDNRYADAIKGTNKKNQKMTSVTITDDEEEEGEIRNESDNEQLHTITKGKTSSNQSAKKKSKSALDMNVLFPKKRKRKEKMGTETSDDPWDARRKPGKTVAETSSMYINPSDDSDYLPSDAATSDEELPSSSRSTSQRKKKGKTIVEKSSDEDSDWLADSDYERPAKKRSKKEADDGSYQYYLKRVEKWKQTETRLTGKTHSFDDKFKLPAHLWESLYNYQRIGVKWLWELHQQRVGGILGDEMGLGKTIQVITFLAGVSCSNLLFTFTNYRGLGPSIIVCPATVMHQWVKEFHKWWPPFRVAILHESGSYSGSKKTLIKSIQESGGILITSYAGIVSNQDEILRFQWHYMILDEGHKIRNPDAQATLTVKQITTPHRIILSGSPLQNNLKELWSLFDFVYPGKLGTLPAFMEQFAVPITLGGYSNGSEVQVATAFKCATILRDIINPYLLRRMKADVKTHLNLPDKNEQVLFCKMTDQQKGVYVNYINSREIESIVQGRFNLFVGLINLRKICNHPNLFDGGPKLIKSTKFSKKIPKNKSGMGDFSGEGFLDDDEEGSDIELSPSDAFGHWSKSGKMIVVNTLLKLWHKQKHKVLLFTQSRQMLCILENYVRQQNYQYLRLDGGTPIGSRQPLIQRFNEDPDIFIFILTTRVGGLGVNLTGANRIIIFDPDWNPSTDSQARERAWRIGQSRQVTIYRLITSGTIEEKMYHRQIFKQFLTNRVLKDPRQKRFFKSNDLLELFSFNEGSGKGTESEAIFAGTGSKIKVKSKAKKKKVENTINPREKSSGKFRDVPNLVKQSKTDTEPTEDIEHQNKEQDEYVLQKLFSKSGVEAALRHDRIVDTDEADYMLVEQEAERVAKEAAAALKRSRDQCWSADSGNVNWTGAHGGVKQAAQGSKPKFGAKRSSTITSAASSSSIPPSANTPKLFSGPSLDEPSQDDLMKPMSSQDLLAIIRARNKPFASESTGENAEEYVSTVKSEHEELLRDLRDYIAFQAMVDGQATTNEVVARFGDRLPPEETPLFKKMLGQLSTFRRVEGQGVWRLKAEFR